MRSYIDGIEAGEAHAKSRALKTSGVYRVSVRM